MTKTYDVIIVGAGAGGGIVAGVLAEAGKRVLLLERGPKKSFEEVGRDHLRNQRISLYGHNAGPEENGNPRVYVDAQGREHIVRPHEGGYQNNAAMVGGGTQVYGAQAWRFMEQDFRMASLYGVPKHSSLADWPITYSELAPYYEKAEWELGVCGDDTANRFQSERSKDYPMPPIPSNPSREILQRGAERLGWNTNPVPMLINTKPYLGRPACIQCSYCVGFSCPSNSKNGTQNTLIPRALVTGNCDLIPHAMTERIDTDSQGNVVGVTYLTEQDGSMVRESATAKVVVVSSGAIESARLLLNSSSSQHPQGLGNEHDLVGRSLQGHFYPSIHGLFNEVVHDGLGPGVSISTTQFNHGNSGVVGGGMLANEFTKLPIIFWRGSLPPDVPHWGAANKRWMRENFSRTLHVMGPVQDIPSPDSRVQVAPNVRDRYGIPVAKLSGTTHPETVKTAQFMFERAKEWMEASGAVRVWGNPPSLGMSAGQHQAGTCRMGDDAQTSVTDKWGRVHAHDNLFVVDASLHVTNGGFNPVLTVMALAYRSAVHIAKGL